MTKDEALEFVKHYTDGYTFDAHSWGERAAMDVLSASIAQLQADNVRMREALHSVIESTTDYNMIDKTNGKQYFKHEIFKHELEVLEETK